MIFAKKINEITLNVLISQSCPVKPVPSQLHVNELTPSTQMPPLLHEVAVQSSVSGKHNKTDELKSGVCVDETYSHPSNNYLKE